jgi:hypothetical protein
MLDLQFRFGHDVFHRLKSEMLSGTARSPHHSLRWQDVPRFRADPEMIRRRPSSAVIFFASLLMVRPI